ncbi:MAG: hypothetical protein ACI8RA_001492, partial [Chlamydiales bacterium]
MEFLENQLLAYLTLVLRYLIPTVLLTLSVTYIGLCPLLYLKRSKSVSLKVISFVAYYLFSPSLWLWSATISLYYLGLPLTVISIIAFAYFAPLVHYLFPMAVLAFFGDWESLLWYGGYYLGVWALNWFVLFAVYLDK